MKTDHFFGAGGALLALIFSILCLTVSALMSLSSASGDRVSTDKTASVVQDYYSADCRAVEITAALDDSIQNGNIPDKIENIAIKAEENGQLSFSVPISEGLALTVRLETDDSSLAILSWQQVRTGKWTPDESLKVWTGESMP